MKPVYLGLFSKIFNAIFDAILKPIIEFFGGLLNDVLGFLFDEVLKPLLVDVFFPMFKTVCEFVFKIIADVLFELYTMMLWLVDLMAHMFNLFGGVTPVEYNGKPTYLMLALFQMSPVYRLIWLLIGLAFILLVFFSMVSVIRSIGELGNEVQHPLSKVMHSTFSGFCKMMAIPLVCIIMMLGTSVVLNSVNNGLSNLASSQYGQFSQKNYRGTQTTIGRCIFVVSTLNAARNPEFNVTHSIEDQSKIGLNDELRAKYYYTDYQEYKGSGAVAGEGTQGSGMYQDAAVEYRDIDAVKKDFDVAEIDYLIGIALVLLFLYTLFRGTITFIARIFYVFLLTIAGPFMGCTYPMDDGKKYEGWKELYIGEFFSAFGLLIGMQVYILLVPVIMDGNLKFGNGTVEANYLIRLIMMGGGAFMIKDVGPVITGLVSSAAANLESSANADMLAKFTKVGMEAWDATKTAYGKAKSMFDRRRMDDKKKKEKGPDAKKGDAIKKSYLGGMFVKGKGNDGKEHWGFSLGSKFNFGLKGDGSVSGNVFGIGWKKGKDGKTDKVSIPFMRLKRGADGKMHVSKVKLAKGMQFRRSEVVDKDGKRTMGKMFCSDLSVIGLKKRFDADTNKVETLSKLGKHYAKTKNAKGESEYVMTHRNFLGSTSVYDRDKQGNYHVVARKGFTSNRAYKLDKETGERKLVSVKSFGGRSLYEDTEEEDDDDDEDTGDTGGTEGNNGEKS